MGIGRTVKNMIGSGDQTAKPTSGSDSSHPFIEGQSGEQESGGIPNLHSQHDRNDHIESAFSPTRQAHYQRSSKLGSDPGSGMYGRGETMIPGNKASGAGNKSGGIEKRGTNEADYGNRGSIGPDVAGGTQHQHRTSDAGGTGLGGGTGMKTNHTKEHRAEHTTKPTKDAINESQFDPVTHESVTQRETEKVLREKDHDQNVQHHIQPVIDKNVKNEVHPDKMPPVTNIRETPDHDETSILHGQTHQHKDSREEGNRERTVIDKGESINEREIHHVHHVVQPIINKQTIEQHRIHTMIPIHQVTHEAPIVHKSQTHAPVSMEHFAQKGGEISGGLTYDQIGSTVLRSGECTREVDGNGESIARELTGSGLPGARGHFGRHFGEGGPGFGKERSGERDQGALHSDIQASSSGVDMHSGTSSKGTTSAGTGTGKRGETTSIYGSQGNAIDSYDGRSNTGPNNTDPMTSNMGAGTSKIGAIGSSSTGHDNRSDSFFQHGGR